VIGSPVILFLLLLLQELNSPTVIDLYKWSGGHPDLSRGPVLMSNPKARELQFCRGNLDNWLASVFADHLADICNGVIVKLRQGLCIFEHLHILQSGRGIGIETKLLDKPKEEVLPGVGLSRHRPGCGRLHKGAV
jgi:hypothetical protein